MIGHVTNGVLFLSNKTGITGQDIYDASKQVIGTVVDSVQTGVDESGVSFCWFYGLFPRQVHHLNSAPLSLSPSLSLSPHRHPISPHLPLFLSSSLPPCYSPFIFFRVMVGLGFSFVSLLPMLVEPSRATLNFCVLIRLVRMFAACFHICVFAIRYALNS